MLLGNDKCGNYRMREIGVNMSCNMLCNNCRIEHVTISQLIVDRLYTFVHISSIDPLLRTRDDSIHLYL